MLTPAVQIVSTCNVIVPYRLSLVLLASWHNGPVIWEALLSRDVIIWKAGVQKWKNVVPDFIVQIGFTYLKTLNSW